MAIFWPFLYKATNFMTFCFSNEKRSTVKGNDLPPSCYKRHDIALIGSISLQKHAYSNIENFTSKNRKFSDKNTSKNRKFSDKKNSVYDFSYFCSKHRLWRGGSNVYPQSVFDQK